LSFGRVVSGGDTVIDRSRHPGEGRDLVENGLCLFLREVPAFAGTTWVG